MAFLTLSFPKERVARNEPGEVVLRNKSRQHKRKPYEHTLIFPHILHGGDYNLEQWPEAIWDDDVKLMQEAHVNVATLPVFGWVSLQPDEDTWTFRMAR